MSALEDAARTAVNRSAVYNATNGRVGSTFTRGSVRGGGVWFWQEPPAAGAATGSGRIWMLRISPRRVLLDLQIAAGATPDAKYGPDTRAALIRMVGADPSITDESLYLTAIWSVYHALRGEVHAPHNTEFPSSAAIREITGDASFTDAIELSTGAEVQNATAIRALAVPQTPTVEATPRQPAGATPASRQTTTVDPAPAPAQETPTAALVRTHTPAELADLYHRGALRWQDIPADVQLQITNLRPVIDAVRAAPAGVMGWVQAHPMLTFFGAMGAIGTGYVLVKEATKKPRREAA